MIESKYSNLSGYFNVQSNLAEDSYSSASTGVNSNLEIYKNRVIEDFPEADLYMSNGYCEVRHEGVAIAAEIYPPKTSSPEKAWYYAQQAVEFASIRNRIRADIENGNDFLSEFSDHVINPFL